MKQQSIMEDAIYKKYYELINNNEISEEQAYSEITKEIQKIKEEYDKKKLQNHKNLDQIDEFIWTNESLFNEWKNKIEEFDEKYGDALMEKLKKNTFIFKINTEIYDLIKPIIRHTAQILTL